MKHTKLIMMCAGVAGAMAVSTALQAQGAPKQLPPITEPPHSRFIGLPGYSTAAVYERRASGANGSEVVSFYAYSNPLRFVAPNQNFKDQNGCFTRPVGFAAIKDIEVFCTMFIWDYKNFVGNDPNMRKAADTDLPTAQWSPTSNAGRNALFARNQVRFVSGPATMKVRELESGIYKNPDLGGRADGKIVVGFTLTPTAATGSVVVSIDGDPRTNNTGTSDDFTRTITW
jgi:hypothetical protein